MPLPFLLYLLGGCFIGGAIVYGLSEYLTDISVWIKNNFSYIVQEAKVKIDYVIVNTKKMVRIRATSQKRETIETIEETNYESLPQEVKDSIHTSGRYEHTLTMVN